MQSAPLLDQLVRKYRSIGAVFDTNLLLLLAVGSYSVPRIATFKRTQKYGPADYALVAQIASRFERLVATPNVMTELDNLARQLPRSEHAAISEAIFELQRNRLELYVPTRDAVTQSSFESYGLTDSALILLSETYLVVTDDFALSNIITSLGRDAVNINHLREWVFRR